MLRHVGEAHGHRNVSQNLGDGPVPMSSAEHHDPPSAQAVEGERQIPRGIAAPEQHSLRKSDVVEAP